MPPSRQGRDRRDREHDGEQGGRRDHHDGHYDLHALAHQAMLERGLQPDFPPEAMRQADRFPGPARSDSAEVRDLRGLAWASIDNDDSRDLDQLSVAADTNGAHAESGGTRLLVAIADVDALVTRGTPCDAHAQWNTTSVYTAGGIFPMLPERLSTDLTSLGQDDDRTAVVISYVVREDGSVDAPEIYRALVRNKAKLAYHSVSDWLNGDGDMPEPMRAAHGIAEQIRVQDEAAHRLRERRHQFGALELETIEPRAVVTEGRVVDLERETKDRARDLIEDLMIAANGVVARFLQGRGYPTFRRVVRTPERWDRIQALAAEYGERLPDEPDSRALERFLARRRKADPLRFPDLSLAVIKMLGAGEYVVQRPGEPGEGHFGLAVRDYSHSTAPNRRYPDLLTQRILKAALEGDTVPYAMQDLDWLAEHCTKQEDAANKVERQIRKSAAAQLLSHRVGDEFDGLVTGASAKGTWVRTLHPPVEGRVVEGERGLDVGDRVTVRLLSTDVPRGFIDFARVR